MILGARWSRWCRRWCKCGAKVHRGEIRPIAHLRAGTLPAMEHRRGHRQRRCGKPARLAAYRGSCAGQDTSRGVWLLSVEHPSAPSNCAVVAHTLTYLQHLCSRSTHNARRAYGGSRCKRVPCRVTVEAAIGIAGSAAPHSLAATLLVHPSKRISKDSTYAAHRARYRGGLRLRVP
jgi:hypothetical protein